MSKFMCIFIQIFSLFLRIFFGFIDVILESMSKLREAIQKSLAVNDPLTAAVEFFEAFAELHPHVALLGPGNSLVRRDYSSAKQIKIVSGGPAGHEPLYSGFIGQGFLTAAIHGDILTSPSSMEILKLIRYLVEPRDCGMLVIIQNNRNDVLNFTLAVAEAQNLNLNVKLLIVNDNCSDNLEVFSGLSGIVLVQKIAGALAEIGEKGLNEIHEICDNAKNNLWSVEIPVKGIEDFSDEICLCSRNPTDTNAQTVEVIEEAVSTLNKYLDGESVYVLLVNTYRMSQIEENIFVSQLIKRLKSENLNVARAYAGSFMGNLDGKGFIVSFMKVDEKILSCLDYPTEALNWKSSFKLDVDCPVRVRPTVKLSMQIEPRGPKITEKQANILLLVLQFVCDALISCDRQLNLIDSECGDGDTGTRLRLVCEDILEALRLKKIDLENCYVFFKTLSRITKDIGSTLGTIYGIIFEAAAQTSDNYDETAEIDYKFYFDCLENAVKSLQSFTKCEDCYMLGPLLECLRVTGEALEKGENAVVAFGQGVSAAEEAAQKRKREGKVFPDPGAHAVGIWMRAAIEGIKLRCEY